MRICGHMNEHRIDRQQRACGLLTIPEQQEFELIIANAKSSGWIDEGDAVTAERSASAIVVLHTRRCAA